MYEFLRQQVASFSSPLELLNSGVEGNHFIAVREDDIQQAELVLGCRFPEELRALYSELGYGFMGGSEKFSPNRVCHPLEIPKIIDSSYEGLVLPEFEAEPNTLPFFERDINLFLCLHPKSDNPNAVYWMWGGEMPNGGKICDSLVEFFQRLVKDPDWFNPPQP